MAPGRCGFNMDYVYSKFILGVDITSIGGAFIVSCDTYEAGES